MSELSLYSSTEASPWHRRNQGIKRLFVRRSSYLAAVQIKTCIGCSGRICYFARGSVCTMLRTFNCPCDKLIRSQIGTVAWTLCALNNPTMTKPYVVHYSQGRQLTGARCPTDPVPKNTAAPKLITYLISQRPRRRPILHTDKLYNVVIVDSW